MLAGSACDTLTDLSMFLCSLQPQHRQPHLQQWAFNTLRVLCVQLPCPRFCAQMLFVSFSFAVTIWLPCDMFCTLTVNGIMHHDYRKMLLCNWAHVMLSKRGLSDRLMSAYMTCLSSWVISGLLLELDSSLALVSTVGGLYFLSVFVSDKCCNQCDSRERICFMLFEFPKHFHSPINAILKRIVVCRQPHLPPRWDFATEPLNCSK